MNYFQKKIEKVLEGFGYERKSFFTGSTGTSVSGISPTQSLKNFTGWVFACVLAIAEDIQVTEFELYEANANDEYERIWNHQILDLLERPNTQMSGADLLFGIASHLELTGNAYVLLDGVKDAKSKPTAMYLLPPHLVKINEGKTIQDPIESYEYRHSGQSQAVKYQPYEIMHIKRPSPMKPWIGYGTLEAIAPWVDTENFATKFNRLFFINGAKLSGVMETERQITESDANVLRQSFNDRHQGVENMSKTAVLPSGVKYKELSNNHKDMDFTEGQRELRDKILAGFRVPKSVLGITDDVNRANAEATNYIFALRTIKPKMRQLVQQLQDGLVARFQDKSKRLVLGFKDPVPENREQMINEMKSATNNAAVMSVNEARDHYFGLPPINNGDSVLTTLGTIALGAVKEQPKGKSSTVIKAKADNSSKRIQDRFNKGVQDTFMSLADTARKYHLEKAIELSNMEYEDYEEKAWNPFVTRLAKYENQQKAIIDQYNENVIEKVKAAVSDESKEKSFDVQDVLDMMDSEPDVKAIIDLSEQLHLELYQEEAMRAAELIGLPLGATITDEVRAAIKEAIELMANSYNETTSKFVGKALNKSVEEGMGLDETIDLLDSVKDQANFTRSVTVAKTEIFRIGNKATRDTWASSDVVKTLTWFTAQDEVVCEFCGGHHGKEVAIDQGFYNLGDVIQGTDGGTMDVKYSEIFNPPMHPNCRCILKPKEIAI